MRGPTGRRLRPYRSCMAGLSWSGGTARARRGDYPRDRTPSADGRARPPGRRVQQGCGDDGAVRRGGRRGAGRHLHRRRARRHPQPRARPTPTRRGHAGRVRRDEMAAAAAILGVRHEWLGFVDSGLPEGDPLPPLPEGCFADSSRWRSRPSRWSRLIRVVPAARHDDLRRERRLPAPRPHHDPQGRHGGLRGGRATRTAYPGARRAVAAAQALLHQQLHQARVEAARGDARGRPGVAVPEWLERWEDRPDERTASPPGSSAPTGSTCGTGRCSPTPPRSTRTARGSPSRPRSSAASGRPRTSSWRARSCRRDLPEDDLFAGLREDTP